jgi:diadenosine tetraphosphate (Ap4A) HIT family hydrolase
MTCPFCQLAHGDRRQVVLENEHCLFIQEPQKVLIGSGVIVPIAHRETVFDLTEDEWAATFSLLKQVKELLDAEYAPQGYNVGWNSGSVAGQEIFHAHLHVIPRYADEPLAGKGIRYWLKQPANIRSG